MSINNTLFIDKVYASIENEIWDIIMRYRGEKINDNSIRRINKDLRDKYSLDINVYIYIEEGRNLVLNIEDKYGTSVYRELI